jgi:hypothetical protein
LVVVLGVVDLVHSAFQMHVFHGTRDGVVCDANKSYIQLVVLRLFRK